MIPKNNKANKIPFWLLKALKIGAASSLAVLIGTFVSVQYASFAGVVALLTIRNTKRDTLAIAAKRLFSYLCSMAVLALLWAVLQDNNFTFAIYMLILAMASCAAGWEDTISVNTVVGSHVLLSETVMTLSFFTTETVLLSIGILSAIVINWYMPDNLAEIQQDIDYIEQELKDILLSIAGEMRQLQPVAPKPVRLIALDRHIEQASDKALDNMNNSMTALSQGHSKYYVEYLAMRKGQCAVLFQCHHALLGIALDHAEVRQVADIIEEVAAAVHHKVGIRAIIAALETVVVQMKNETLPQTSIEFASAAQLFHIMELFEEFLHKKRAFLLTLTEREKDLYWKE